jgi:hypothetical protein
LITELTLNRIRELLTTGSMGNISIKGIEKVAVKGKEKPVGIYEVTSGGPDSESIITEYDEEKVVRLKEKK